MPQNDPITFLVPGTQRSATRAAADAAPPPEEVSEYGTVKQSVQVAAVRAGQAQIAVSAVPGEDVVVLHIDGGPSIVLHPENARDLMMAQLGVSRSGVAAPAAVQVPVRLQWRGLDSGVPSRGATRGALGDVLLKAVQIVKGKAVGSAADLTAIAIARKFDSKVKAGVYQLGPKTLPPQKTNGTLFTAPASADGPFLVLVHGTFSTTDGTFGKLWSDHPDHVAKLFANYGNRVLGLDHPTLSVSPIANALTLVDALPAGARLHLLTHSRGGLVAEVLARVCGEGRGSLDTFEGEGDGGQSRDLRALQRMVAAKKITVERIVRVACPARGTLLASKRLDAYLSVFKWTLELAGIPVAPELIGFLSEVAQRRADPDLMPGLSAQIPNSPLVRWLNAAETSIPGDLRVVAGDMDGDSVVSWLKTLLADGFYWTDNDLVVQTRSMYGGTPRQGGGSFVLDQGARVSHFNYFANAVTAAAIVDALTLAEPSTFAQIGPLSWSGKSATGTRAAAPQKDDGSRPAVFVLPGILGSNLKADGKRVWLGWRMAGGFSKLRYSSRKDAIEPDGPLEMFYDDLAQYLSSTHHVIPFGFDWRKPIEAEAARLAARIREAITARERSNQPVRIVAHSMGGIVARAVELADKGTWDSMLNHAGSRVLMLGTPNGGSWAPMQVLSGDDTMGNLIGMVGAPFQMAETRRIIAAFPGLLQLQAGLLDSDLKLSREEEWQRLADADLKSLADSSWWHRLPLQLDMYRWGVPAQPVLDAAVSLRTQLNAQASRSARVFRDRVVLVAGRAEFTPGGFELLPEGVVYKDVAGEGDGRVLLTSALLPGVATWSADCAHGDLPRRQEAFPAYLDLLQSGATARLPRVAPAGGTRGAVAAQPIVVRSRPSRTTGRVRPPRQEADVLSPAERIEEATSSPALRVSVVHGDLTFVAEPLLLGHYKSGKLTGAERVMDTLVGGQMSASLDRGLYPVAPETNQVFINTVEPRDNPWQLPRPKAVIVVGLGDEGALRGEHLVASVRQAVIAWAQRLTEDPDPLPTFTLAATLIGSGGAKITAGESAQLVAQGVREANERLQQQGRGTTWPYAAELRLIELYHDRAMEAWQALQVLAASTAGTYRVDPAIATGSAGLARLLDGGYRGADYDFISAIGEKTAAGETRISYTLDSKRARNAMVPHAIQPALIRQLVSGAPEAMAANPQVGRTLFKLLVPVEIEPALTTSTETLLEVDGHTAGIPWELLDTDTRGQRHRDPWSIRTKLLRRLRTRDYRPHPVDTDNDASILIIGEPQCDPRKYPRLPGARKEARAIDATFKEILKDSYSRSVKSVIRSDDDADSGSDAATVINAVFERDWRIVHIAGHGEPVKSGAEPRGVVLSDDLFLGGTEIKSMRAVPQLVFVNCCHLAARNVAELLGGGAAPPETDRAHFAAGVAQALIEIGVRCVVAAAWAVEDRQATLFATTFYSALLRGRRFMDAVGEARKAAYAAEGNTWAAYQCYGDPDWTFKAGVADAQRPRPRLGDEYAAIASAETLELALDTISTWAKYDSGDAETRKRHNERNQQRLRYLEEHFGTLWGDSGRIAAAFGLAWADLGVRTEAVRWLERARTAGDGSASGRALEQLANLRVRLAWETFAGTSGQPAARAAAGAAARKEIRQATSMLEQLLQMGQTAERHSLLGSAQKRLAMIAVETGDEKAAAAALDEMAGQYLKADTIAEKTQAPNRFYPAMNRMAAELAKSAGWRPDKKYLTALRKSLTDAGPDFWTVVGQTELALYEALFDGTLAASAEQLKAQFQRHHDRVASPGMWASVYDNGSFVLGRYSRTAAAASERRAAAALLQALAQLAGRTATKDEQQGARRKRTPPKKSRRRAGVKR